MCPISSMAYSTTSGTSGDILRLTVPLRGVACKDAQINKSKKQTTQPRSANELFQAAIGSASRMARAWRCVVDRTLANELRYRSAKVSDTSSSSLICTLSLSSSIAAFCLQVMLPVPRSPDTLNLTPSLEAEILTVSPITVISEQMRLNSAEGIWTHTQQGPQKNKQ